MKALIIEASPSFETDFTIIKQAAYPHTSDLQQSRIFNDGRLLTTSIFQNV